jgi:hypothetical protein
MDTLLSIVKYGFVIGLGIEFALIARALINLAREKARSAAASVAE